MTYNSTTTLRRIRDAKPCREGWTKLLAHLGKAGAHADQLVADMAQPVTPQEAARIICDASNEFSPLMYRGWTLHDESGGNGTFWYVFSPEWTSLAPYGFDHPEFAMVSGDYQEAKEAVDRRIASLTTPPQKKEE